MQNLINTAQLSTNTTQTMSSREIAELCDKEHSHVLRDIRTMYAELNIETNFGLSKYQDSTGRKLPLYNLNKEMTPTLVAGYSIKLRHKIIQRWQELLK